VHGTKFEYVWPASILNCHSKHASLKSDHLFAGLPLWSYFTVWLPLINHTDRPLLVILSSFVRRTCPLYSLSHQERLWDLLLHYLLRMRLCFYFGLFVCLFACLLVCLSVHPSDNWKSCELILTKFLGGVGHGSGTISSILVTIRVTVRIQESEVRIHWIIELPTDFDEILRRAGAWPRDQLLTFWWRYDPNHYPDPGVRSGPPSGSGKTGVRRRSVLFEYF